MYAPTPQAAESHGDIVHYPEFSLVGFADAIDYELSLVCRQLPFDFIGLGYFLEAYLAYVFNSNLLYPDVEPPTPVTAFIWSDLASSPKGFSFYLWVITNYVGMRV